ncbi:MAG TPA: aminotransferase class I/II-fold pyridoxal phosphate-dependent enzyme [Candidatus Bilamarchaeum sp.]|nr:aminotransferase class I/II-fold pyridoxal phosphate-dependent enzyme [Candidatus Bilamarchaeum sp.]
MVERKLASRNNPSGHERTLRAAMEFSSERYSVNATDIGAVSDLLIDKTDVDRFIEKTNRDRSGLPPYEIHEMRLGDPTKYEGLGPYDGYHRHHQRFINFNPPSAYAGYLIPGDESLKARLRLGRTKTPGYVRPPSHLEVYVTPGVAGALRLVDSALLLPPTRPDPEVVRELRRLLVENGLTESTRETLLLGLETLEKQVLNDNVVIPKWTYVSHMAETSLAHGEFKLCDITSDGQVDLKDLANVIDVHTRAVLFATVGNPLTVAMKPEVFDGIMRIVQDKMKEHKHPIVVVADTIYEQYRRDHESRIDAVQRALKLDAAGIKVPVIEMSSFSKMLAIPGERVGYARILWDPDVFPEERPDFLKSLRNIYGPSLNPVACSVQRALGALYSSVRTRLPVEEELAPVAAILTALVELGKDRKELPITLGDTQILLRDKNAREANHFPKNIKPHVEAMGVPGGFYSCRKVANKTRKIANRVLGRYGIDIDSEYVLGLCSKLEAAGLIEMVKIDDVHFFKPKCHVPAVPRNPDDGQLELYGLASNPDWMNIVSKCSIPTEDVLYQTHKKMMRDNVFERVMHFARGIDKMHQEGLGVYLHPSYYDEKGELDPSRFNAFYVLWGFDKFRENNGGASQARVLAEKCVELGRPIIACVPGESFLPSELRRTEPSYIRAVALLPIEKLNEVLKTISLVAREIKNG